MQRLCAISAHRTRLMEFKRGLNVVVTESNTNEERDIVLLLIERQRLDVIQHLCNYLILKDLEPLKRKIVAIFF